MSTSEYLCKRASKHKKVVRKFIGSGIGLPSAPIFRTKIRPYEYAFQERKQKLFERLPVYKVDEIRRMKSPHWALIIDSLLDDGYQEVVDEVGAILKRQERMIQACSDYSKIPYKLQQEKFTKLAETLKFCFDLRKSGRIEHAVALRKDFAVQTMNDGELWLARHLLVTGLRQAKTIPDAAVGKRIVAEIHCLLGFMGTLDCGAAEVNLDEAIAHLIQCRKISQKEIWHFRPNVLTISIKRPVHLLGLRNDIIAIDGNSLPLYLVASLLEHQLLVKLVNKILFSTSSPTHEDVGLAMQYATEALKFAFEIRQPEVLSSALIRFGIMLRDTGNYDEAMDYFDKAQAQSEMHSDGETEAMAYYGLATCFIRRREPIHALEMFVVQKEKADKVPDVGAEALQGVGTTLLSEGQTLEAKECLALAIRDISWAADLFGTPERCLQNSWSLDGIIRGLDLWGRFAGLARRRAPSNLKSLVRYKNLREPLPRVPRPDYVIPHVRELEKFAWGEPRSLNKKAEDTNVAEAILLLTTAYGLQDGDFFDDYGRDGVGDVIMDVQQLEEKIAEMNRIPWMPAPLTLRKGTTVKSSSVRLPSTRKTLTDESEVEEDAESSLGERTIFERFSILDDFDEEIRFESDRDYENAMFLKSEHSSSYRDTLASRSHSHSRMKVESKSRSRSRNLLGQTN